MTSPPAEWPLDVTVRSPAPAELISLPLPQKVAALRHRRLGGLCVGLQPYERSHGEALRELRNLPHNKTNLAQTADITPDQQRAWEDSYFARTNDLCWILLTRAGGFAGSVSLYSLGTETAETGRLVVREEVARSTPVIAECELMIQWLTFGWLGLPRLLARIQPGNSKMVVMHERLGFQVTGPDTIRGVPYLRLEMAASAFRPEPHVKVLRHWLGRATGLTPGSTRPD